jgi:phosphoserine aminotransferase
MARPAERVERAARVYNFSAGPAMLPAAVLERARAELTDLAGTGMGVMEWSHRSPEFVALLKDVERKLRAALGVPDGYRVLFLQGGATLQFGMIPLNLMGGRGADYVHTGHWGGKAIEEARRVGRVNLAWDGQPTKFTTVAPPAEWRLDADAAYLHYTPNETIAGVEFHAVPDVAGRSGEMPLVADMSSSILSRPVDVSRFALIYAGAQKNMGPAGLTVVILREDVLRDVPKGTPAMLDYRAHLGAQDGMLNTPPTFGVYLLGLMLDWLADQGGVAAMGARNAAKSAKLYGYIDGSGFYRNPVDPAWRSRMNLPFILARPELDAEFLAGARRAGLANLEGHRSVGGMRASLYNAMPEDGVDALIAYMREFARAHG